MGNNAKNIRVSTEKQGVEKNYTHVDFEGGDFTNEKKRNAQKTRLVEITAKLMNVSKDDVYKILRGRHENDQVFTCYMTLMEKEIIMIEQVKNLVPFNI